MNQYKEWNKKKSSGTFRRSVLKNRTSMLTKLVPPADCNENDRPEPSTSSALTIPDSPEQLSPNGFNIYDSDEEVNQLNEELANDDWSHYSPSEGEDPEPFPSDDECPEPFNIAFDQHQIDEESPEVFLRKWAIKYNIRQYALRELLQKLGPQMQVSTNPRNVMRMLF